MATKKMKKTAKKSSASKASAKKTSAKKAPAKKAKTGGKRPESGALSMTSASPGFTVNDLDKSLTWYRDVVGFVVDERWERDGKLAGVSLQAGKVTFMIGQDDWKKGRDRRKGEGFRLYCETTQDVDALAAKIKARGGTLDEEPRDTPWGSRDFSLTDPDGFKLTIGKESR
jgi:uncharacterized glyoxalase superfamily protein PhnB